MRAFLVFTLLFAATGYASSPPCDTPTCAMRRATARYQRCYREALKESPRLTGKARFTITIRENGTVEKVELDLSDFPDASPVFAKCLRDATWKLHFREDLAPTVVIWPATFLPGV